MKLTIRSPTGSEISYTTTLKTARSLINTFSRNVPTELYEVRKTHNQLLLILKENSHE